MHITHKPWTARYERASAARDDIAFESTPIAVSYDYEHKFYDGIDDVNDDEKNHRLFTVEEARELARSFANEVI
jgi:hypothetical protein